MPRDPYVINAWMRDELREKLKTLPTAPQLRKYLVRRLVWRCSGCCRDLVRQDRLDRWYPVKFDRASLLAEAMRRYAYAVENNSPRWLEIEARLRTMPEDGHCHGCGIKRITEAELPSLRTLQRFIVAEKAAGTRVAEIIQEKTPGKRKWQFTPLPAVVDAELATFFRAEGTVCYSIPELIARAREEFPEKQMPSRSSIYRWFYAECCATIWMRISGDQGKKDDRDGCMMSAVIAAGKR